MADEPEMTECFGCGKDHDFEDGQFCKECEDGFKFIAKDHEAREIAQKYEDRYFDARSLLQAIVDQYDAIPDGPLGKGFTNGPFLAVKDFIKNTASKEVKG